ncbi:MAG: DEAD/DEAH box helicase [Fimbriimonadaceae bacterium]|nr:DEAD/DEAH box helicase [Fimbriimonadaceae bacterium]
MSRAPKRAEFSADGLRAAPDLMAHVVHWFEQPARDGTFAELPEELHPETRTALESLGITRLYTHQRTSYDAIRAGQHAMLVSGTNAGKTLAFTLPVREMLRREPMARAIFVYPTKALAQDQLQRLRAFWPDPHHVAVLDGDTPSAARRRIREEARCILTNPDMLHHALLPGHATWSKLFRALRFLVVDEIHSYRGIFGAHVGNVFRRTLRLAESYRSHPQVIAASATLGNPAEHFSAMTELQPLVIADESAPRGKRSLLVCAPDLYGQSGLARTVAVLRALMDQGVRTLVFSRSRVSAELVMRRIRAELGEDAPIESYRAGYTARERREIERRLRDGELLALSATSAMELGVDVGHLDAVVVNGFPGTISSFWQQVGRAGRGSRSGLALYLAQEDPLEQFFVRSPELLLDRAVEDVVAHPGNPPLLRAHLRCAASERPLSFSELDRFGPNAAAIVEAMERAGELRYRNGQFENGLTDQPTLAVNLRGDADAPIRLMVGGELLGEMERWRARLSAHAGAIYLHRGNPYRVESLDLGTGVAVLVPSDAPYYTQPVVQSLVQEVPEPPQERAAWRQSRVRVTSWVVGYRRIPLDGRETAETIPLDLPPETFETDAVLWEWSREPSEEFDNLQAALHGAEHALMAVAPYLAGCDRVDLGSQWAGIGIAGSVTLGPTIAVYDRLPGGIGLSDRLYQLRERWQALARDLLTSCACATGCPRCLLSARCESGNEMLDKSGAVRRLSR